MDGSTVRRDGITIVLAIFAVATPDEFTIWCADPAIGTAILQNRNEFQQAPVVSSILGFLGSNVFMTNGDGWYVSMTGAFLDKKPF
ncbi:unnamed protein product [Penicillium manginii]